MKRWAPGTRRTPARHRHLARRHRRAVRHRRVVVTHHLVSRRRQPARRPPAARHHSLARHRQAARRRLVAMRRRSPAPKESHTSLASSPDPFRPDLRCRTSFPRSTTRCSPRPHRFRSRPLPRGRRRESRTCRRSSRPPPRPPREPPQRTTRGALLRSRCPFAPKPPLNSPPHARSQRNHVRIRPDLHIVDRRRPRAHGRQAAVHPMRVLQHNLIGRRPAGVENDSGRENRE